MFEFAISQHQKRPPTRRWVASSIFSCVAHVAALVILILNPALLRPGKGHWLKHLELIQIFRPAPKQPVQEGWRTVALVGSGGAMKGLSAETLRRYAYDWSKGSGTAKTAPVRVQLDKDVASESRNARTKPLRPALGTQDPKPAVEPAAGARPQEGPAAGEPGARAVESAGAPVEVAASRGTGVSRGATPLLPEPERAAPRQIPPKVPTVEPPSVPPAQAGLVEPPAAKRSEQAQSEPKVFADQRSAIQSTESGFFDTKGFPLGEYARIVVDRIKGNWMIPSNLRNSQGRSAVIFYIERNGRVWDARVISSSGISSLDLAALSSILGSNPFPPLPPGFPGERVGAKFVFAYNERH